MKNISLFLLSFFYISFLFSQSLTPEVPEFYFLQGQVFNGKTHKPIPNVNYGLGERLRYHVNGNFFSDDHGMVFTPNGNTLSRPSKGLYDMFSPNKNSVIYPVENDLWYANFDIRTGTKSNPKRLTELGIFYGGVEIYNWYKDNVLVYINDKFYQIHLPKSLLSESVFKDKHSIGVFPGYTADYMNIYPNSYARNSFSNKCNLTSPDGRYIIARDGNQPEFIFDMNYLTKKNFKHDLPLFEYSSCFWLSNSSAVIYTGNSGYDIESDYSFIYADINSGDVFFLFRLPAESFGGSYFDRVLKYFHTMSIEYSSYGGAIIFSKDNTYMLIPSKTSDINYKYVYTCLLFNLETNQFESLPAINFFPFDDYRSLFLWISKNTFIYKQEGDVLSQGTWSYNVVTKEKKKLTPFILESSILLEKSNKVLFTANRHLFSMNTDGSNLEQISKTQLSNSKLIKIPSIVSK